MKRHATSTDVANLAGVSQVTVSRALSGKGPVAEKTRLRIQESARQLGYRLNGAARAARRGYTGNIALLLSTVEEHSRLPAALVQSIYDALISQNLHLTVARLDDLRLTSEEAISKILSDTVADGLICNYTHHVPPEMVDLMERYRIPSVWLNTPLSKNCVIPSDKEAARMATEHLIELGHRSIGYFAFRQSDHYSEQDRCKGYQLAMKQEGLPESSTLLQTSPPYMSNRAMDDNRLELCRDYLQKPGAPKAVVTYSQHTADALLVAALQLGLQVPGDLSLTTVGDNVHSPFGRTITTALLPADESGKHAVDIILRKIADPDHDFPPISIAPRLCLGSTTGPPL